MSRVSRKQINQVRREENGGVLDSKLRNDKSNDSKFRAEKPYQAAIYARLSNENGNHSDETSIKWQKEIVRRYLEERGDISILAEYEDNGFTGTNFARPGFEAMMQAVREGRINCIAVKDMSRFARDFIEAGNYIERIFPYLGVRFIAVNEGYDSLDTDCNRQYLSLGLTNLVNEMYAKDISKKIQPVIHQKQEEGIYIGSVAPFGYLFGSDSKKTFVIDEEAAPIVRRIFQMYMEGNSMCSIVKILNSERISSPYAYAAGKNPVKMDCDSQTRGKLWSVTTIGRILQSPIYIGHMAVRKSKQSLYDGIKCYKIQAKDWLIKENRHEPLISSEMFEQIQIMIQESKKKYKDKIEMSQHCGQNKDKWENIWRGKLFCGECGKPLKANYSQYRGYFCKVARETYGTVCKGTYINEKNLSSSVIKVIKTQAKLAIKVNQQVKLVRPSQSEERKHRISILESQIEEIDYFKMSLYEEYYEGLLKKGDYLSAQDRYNGKKAGLEMELCREVNRKERDNLKVKDIFQQFLKFGDKNLLTKEMVDILIEKVMISADHHISITLKFQDEMDALIRENKDFDIRKEVTLCK